MGSNTIQGDTSKVLSYGPSLKTGVVRASFWFTPVMVMAWALVYRESELQAYYAQLIAEGPTLLIADGFQLLIFFVLMFFLLYPSLLFLGDKVARIARWFQTGGDSVKDDAITDQDAAFITAHEAAHALTYAALGSLPPDFYLMMKDNNDETSRALGAVSGISSRHQLAERTLEEWRMLVFIAGRLGEEAVLGTSTLGSEGDHGRWVYIARRYLCNHFDGVFYNAPANRLEQEHNSDKFTQLQEKQTALVNRLLAENADTFTALREALLEKKTMNRDDIYPYLKDVILPDGFPQPLGQVSAFSLDWPEDAGLS